MLISCPTSHRLHPVGTSFFWLFVAALFLTACFLTACSDGEPAPTPHSEVAEPYTGRYALNDDLVLSVTEFDGRLRVLPSLWRTSITLEPDPDSPSAGHYRSLLHPKTKFRFAPPDPALSPSLRIDGHKELEGDAARLAPGDRKPIELLLEGQGAEAFTALVESGLETPERAVQMARRHIGYFPSRTQTSAAFSEALARHYPQNGSALATLGAALVQADRRAEALEVYLEAEKVAPEDSLTEMALRYLAPDRPPPAGTETVSSESPWRLPFELDDLFATPTALEIDEVRSRWAERDLRPTSVRTVHTAELHREDDGFDVRILAHSVHGDLHYGAIFLPQRGCEPRGCPVVVDIRGVSWNYQPHDISRGVRSMDVLRDRAAEVVYVVPSIRGEVLTLGDQSFESEGDRRFGWDGGADDTLALLEVALQETPEVDSERICLFGKSRGGSVGLLAAARDSRIRCVVDWAGPADWFTTMGIYGWTLQELVAEGLYQRWDPGQGWGSSGQFIERILQDTINTGKPTLAESRLRVLASSPLYFVETLPAADLHYGAQDGSVGRANAEALERGLVESTPTGLQRSLTLHPRAGHDMPWPQAYDTSRDFLVHHLQLEGGG